MGNSLVPTHKKHTYIGVYEKHGNLKGYISKFKLGTNEYSITKDFTKAKDYKESANRIADECLTLNNRFGEDQIFRILFTEEYIRDIM